MWFIRRQMRSNRGGLSLAQFRSLVRANQAPAATLSMIAEFLGATLPTASRIVAGLVDKGLLDRAGCNWDRRQVQIGLTPRGKEVLQTARRATQQCMESELSGLTAKQRTTLSRGTEILRILFARTESPLAVKNKAGGRKRRLKASTAL